MSRETACLLLLMWMTLAQASTGPASAPMPPTQTYSVYVASESADRIALVRFGPGGAVVDHDLMTGIMPTDIDGPHGLTVSPDKKFYYVSLAHGRPFGSVWKYSTKDDSVVG